MTKIEIFLGISEKFQIFRKFWQKLNFFFENVTNIEVSSKIWPKSKFFENYDQNRKFSKILTKTKFFKILTKIAIFFENLTKIENFRNIRKKRNFSKIWLKSTFFDIFPNFDQNRFFFRKFDQNRNFFEHSTKIEILTKSKFPENLTKIEIFRNCRKCQIFSQIFTKIKIFRKFD